MSRTVVEHLRPLHPIRVENAAFPGTPDLCYVEGWIELKECPSWPSGPQWPMRVPHFRPEQRIWLRRRVEHGGRAHLMLKVGRDWLLLAGDVAASVVGLMNEDDLKAQAELVWTTKERGCWDRVLWHLCPSYLRTALNVEEPPA